MLFSLITVTYNAESSISKTLDSVKNQSCKDFELIIIDGNSNDNTLEIIKSYRDLISIIISEPDSGIYDAMNKGIRLAKGDWLFFLNSGDYFYDFDVLSKLSNEINLNKNQNFQLFYGKSILFSNLLNISLIKGREISIKDMYFDMPITHQSILFSRQSFLTIKEFDINFKRSADHNWLVQFYISGGKAKFIDQVISYYEIESFSSNSIWIRKYEKLKISLKYFNIRVKSIAIIKFSYYIIRAFLFDFFVPRNLKNYISRNRFNNKKELTKTKL